MMKMALVSSKGGTGKTSTAVALACHWVKTRRSVLVVDIDDQDTGSASWWLDRTDDQLEGLSWVKTTAAELVQQIDQIKADIVIVDTPPSISSRDLTTVSGKVDLVLIPGKASTTEVTTIAQTYRTIHQENPTTTCSAVFTRTPTATISSTKAKELLAILEEVGCQPIGRIRHYEAAADAPGQGLRLDQISGNAGTQLAADIAELASNIEQKWNLTHGTTQRPT